MDFIRSEKSQPDYDENTRHCLYGLDADLVSGVVIKAHFKVINSEKLHLNVALLGV